MERYDAADTWIQRGRDQSTSRHLGVDFAHPPKTCCGISVSRLQIHGVGTQNRCLWCHNTLQTSTLTTAPQVSRIDRMPRGEAVHSVTFDLSQWPNPTAREQWLVAHSLSGTLIEGPRHVSVVMAPTDWFVPPLYPFRAANGVVATLGAYRFNRIGQRPDTDALRSTVLSDFALLTSSF